MWSKAFFTTVKQQNDSRRQCHRRPVGHISAPLHLHDLQWVHLNTTSLSFVKLTKPPHQVHFFWKSFGCNTEFPNCHRKCVCQHYSQAITWHGAPWWSWGSLVWDYNEQFVGLVLRSVALNCVIISSDANTEVSRITGVYHLHQQSPTRLNDRHQVEIRAIMKDNLDKTVVVVVGGASYKQR